MVCSEAAADESLAAIRARIRLGMAMAAMIRMMATTISSSISEKPFCCFRISLILLVIFFDLMLVSGMTQSGLIWHLLGRIAGYLGSGLGEGQSHWLHHATRLQSHSIPLWLT